MSSLVNESEIALTRHALDAAPARPLDVLVGGLGLGHTAAAALEDDRVASLVVVERLAAVIDWHRPGPRPARSAARRGSAHAVRGGRRLRAPGPEGDDAPYDLVLARRGPLARAPCSHPSHAAFYEAAGLARLEQRLRPGGLFGLWSADATDGEFLRAHWPPSSTRRGSRRSASSTRTSAPRTSTRSTTDGVRSDRALLGRGGHLDPEVARAGRPARSPSPRRRDTSARSRPARPPRSPRHRRGT